MLALLILSFPSPFLFAQGVESMTERVSVASTGAQATGASTTPALSADGRYVAFVSAASNLVPGDTNRKSDVFVHFSNYPPDAVDDSATTTQNTPVAIVVLANDTDPDDDPLTVTGVTHGSGGAVLVNADNTVTYTPVRDFIGTDAFTYTISDGYGGTDTA